MFHITLGGDVLKRFLPLSADVHWAVWRFTEENCFRAKTPIKIKLVRQI